MRDLQAALVQVVDGFAAITEVTGAQGAEVKAAAVARQGAELAEDQAAQAIARSDQDRTVRRQAEQAAEEARGEAAQVKQQAADTVAAYRQAYTQGRNEPRS